MEGQLHQLIITGPLQSGKTTRLKALKEAYRQASISCGGVITEALHINEKRLGYDFVSAADGERMPALRTEKKMLGDARAEQATPAFWFSLDAFAWAASLIKRQIDDGIRVIFIDEVGRYELQGKGFCDTVRLVTSTPETSAVLAVRDAYLEEVVRYFSLQDYRILHTGAHL